MKWILTNSTDINNKANKFSKSGKNWHFHILTPECKFNRKKKYAFILENSTDKKIYVIYSDKPNMDLGKTLLKMLHGISVSKTKVVRTDNNVVLNPDLNKLISRAKQLSNDGKYWHHHMLLPICIFNSSNKFVIMLEDREKNEVTKAHFGTEPKQYLKEIETLFYQQKKLK